jgi:signal transduction histidine kinase
VATDRGLFSIPAFQASTPGTVPLILTTSLVRDGKEIRIRGDGKIVSVPGPPNEFTFKFSSPSFMAEDGTMYRYILEGLNADWRPYDDYTEITYSDIQPGRYTFKVQAANVLGAKSPIITAEIDIESPWYQSETAVIFYIVGGLILVFGLVRINSYRLVKRNEYLVNLVEARTEEIKLQNEQLARQAEEIQQINDVRSKLMRMAIHDLRNPLHVLGGYFELLRDAHEHEERKDIYKNSRQVISRMLQKVNRLLDEDRQRYFKEDTAKENIALRDVLVELIRANSILADKKGQSIHSTFDSVVIVVGNREELYVFFDNLIYFSF